jgi:RNA polymerase sigma-70 factor (ECF subfamily)
VPTPKAQTDLAAVRAALADPVAYTPLVDRYAGQILRYIQRISGVSTADAEDLTQLTFIRAYQSLNAFDQQLTFSTWLYRIAHNLTVSDHRARTARAQTISLTSADLAPLVASTVGPEQALDQALLAEQVRSLLTTLPAAQREVLVLYYLEDKSYEEISDILRTPAGTVASLLSRARATLRRAAERAGLHSATPPTSHS